MQNSSPESGANVIRVADMHGDAQKSEQEIARLAQLVKSECSKQLGFVTQKERYADYSRCAWQIVKTATGVVGGFWILKIACAIIMPV